MEYRRYDVYVQHPTETGKKVFLKDALPEMQATFANRGERVDKTMTSSSLRQKGLGHTLRAEAMAAKGAERLTDRNRKHMFRAIAGVFPSFSQLWKWGKIPSATCDLCGCLNPTTAHIQHDCNQLASARTAAHNHIWAHCWPKIKQVACSKGWSASSGKTILQSGLKHDCQYKRWQPDGILTRMRRDGFLEILLLDLARNRGYDEEYFGHIDRRKREGYGELAANLELNQKCIVQIFPLPIGMSGNISEKHWNSLTKAIGGKDKHAKRINSAATAEGCRAFTYMVDMWRVAQMNEREARRADLSGT